MQNVNCPTCAKTLQDIVAGCLVCPDGHGVLLPASSLVAADEELIEKVDAIDKEVSTAQHRQYPIACPACRRDMSVVNYCGSGIFIDSCMKVGCNVRWLDGEELRRIKDRKLQNDPDNLLKLVELEIQTDKMRNAHRPDNNPSLPAFSRPLLSSPRFSFLGVGLIVSRIIRACIESPFVRSVTFFIFLVIAVVAYLIWHALQKIM